MSPLGNRRDWKDSDLSQIYRRNVWQVVTCVLVDASSVEHYCVS